MYYMPTKNKIGVIDLFCGIGGLSHGMYKEGLDIIAGFDIDDTCKYAYEKNNKSTFYNQDIKTVTKVELPFIVSAYSEDSLIEAVEYIDDNHFIIGLQFHPENIESMQIIFDKFVKVCKEFKEKRLINY